MSEGKIQAGRKGLCLSHEHVILAVLATKIENQNDIYMLWVLLRESLKYDLCYCRQPSENLALICLLLPSKYEI